MTPIYVVGSSNTDMVVKAPKLPLPGETIMGGKFFMNPGGKGANQAVAAARLGGKVFFVANIGSDLFGQESVQRFQRDEQIDTSLVTMDAGNPSGVALIVVDTKGENSITVAPGSNDFLDVQKVSHALDSIASPAIVLLQMEIPTETVAHVIQIGFEKELTVILNPAPARPLSAALLKKLNWITPNETEAQALTGVQVVDQRSASEAAQKLRAAGVPNIVITMGAQGAFLCTTDLQKMIPAPQVSVVADTTAAGDCFNGALAVALSENKSAEEAVGFACRAASISVTRLGAQSSLPHRREVGQLSSITSHTS